MSSAVRDKAEILPRVSQPQAASLFRCMFARLHQRRHHFVKEWFARLALHCVWWVSLTPVSPQTIAVFSASAAWDEHWTRTVQKGVGSSTAKMQRRISLAGGTHHWVSLCHQNSSEKDTGHRAQTIERKDHRRMQSNPLNEALINWRTNLGINMFCRPSGFSAHLHHAYLVNVSG